ncbi:MAG: D-alanyl-D-alanine carboxypeptidase [Gammaproteobacteria bacterium]|nr:D-alanyl-D-alanine carboxypeptidase [Gammaproteobacteria bacterium]
MIKMLRQFFFLCVFVSTTAEAVVAPVPAPPKQAATSFLLIDFNSGRILAEKNSDEQIEPASITKLMTAYVVYKELDAGRLTMDEMVTISEKAWRMGGSKMFVEVGKKVSIEDLLKGLVIQSGNDATIALAEHIAGSESTFADYMNQYARALGMNGTNFVNSTGWPHKDHRTSARDIATLGKAIIEEFPERYKLYAEKQFTYNGIPQYNRNKLLWRDDSVDGMKTGHTESAGYCLISSAKRDDMRLIAVVLGTRSEKARADVSQSLLSYGFRFFESSKLYAAGEGLNKARIWKGENENLSLGLKEDLHVTIPRGQYKYLDAVMEVNKDIVAPVEKGQQLGTVKVMLDGEEIISRPLVALQAVAEGSIWQRTKDQIIQLFQ